MAVSAHLIAYYPYATPDDLKATSGSLGAVRLTPVQIEAYAVQVAKFTQNATWTIDTNTVGVFYKIANCADQDAVAQRAVTGMVGRRKTVYGSLVEARKRKKLVCVPTAAVTEAVTGMSNTTKLLIGGGVIAVLGIGVALFLRG